MIKINKGYIEASKTLLLSILFYVLVSSKSLIICSSFFFLIMLLINNIQEECLGIKNSIVTVAAHLTAGMSLTLLYFVYKIIYFGTFKYILYKTDLSIFYLLTSLGSLFISVLVFSCLKKLFCLKEQSVLGGFLLPYTIAVMIDAICMSVFFSTIFSGHQLEQIILPGLVLKMVYGTAFGPLIEVKKITI